MKYLDIFKEQYLDRYSSARAAKEKGIGVVGYLCNFVPEELIMAAGFFPLRLSGSPETPVPDDVNAKFLSGGALRFGKKTPEGFIATILDDFISERLDFMDYLVIPRGRDSVHHFYDIACAIKKANPSLKAPEPYFIDRLHTQFFMNQIYNREQLFEFKTQLGKWSGKAISTDAIKSAVSVCYENECLLHDFSNLRESHPPRVYGAEALQVIGSSMFMPKEDHTRLLQGLINDFDQLPVKEGTRLFVCGSPLDNLKLYNIIEGRDAIVIGEDHCWGKRSTEILLKPHPIPMDSVLEKFNNRPLCPSMFTLDEKVDYSVRNAMKAKADGVIFYVLEHDHIQSWEIPTEIERLSKQGIPALHLKGQAYDADRSPDLSSHIDAFLKEI